MPQPGARHHQLLPQATRIAAYPMFEALDIGSTTRLRPVPLRDPRLRRRCEHRPAGAAAAPAGVRRVVVEVADDETLVDVSLAQRRILLTRDRALLKRRVITHGVFVDSDDLEEQTLEVIRRLDLSERLAPLMRCLRCNGELVAVGKEEVIDRLEPFTRRYYTDFSRCADCGRIYWPGSHYSMALRFVDRLREQPSERDALSGQRDGVLTHRNRH